MLGKILLTVVVILAAFIVLRQRHMTARRERSEATAPTETAADSERENFARDMRFAAYTFLVLMVGLGGFLYYYRWQDDHTILTVTLHRDDQEEPVTYRVYKYQMGERSFTTVDGTAVTVAASERMEVEGLD